MDINKLTIKELIGLNRKIVERVKHLRQLETHQAMDQFNYNDYVSFEGSCGHIMSGRIFKFNKKTISVVSENGDQWNVHPSMLRKTIENKNGTPIINLVQS